jgi:Kef-type K+ transport system membrane component KefB
MFLFIYILIGILLGPSFVKASIPEWIFSVCSFGFLFISGFELDLNELKKDFKLSAKLASGAFLVPFLAGLGFAYLALEKNSWQGLLVVAIALAISALPVVVQILKDLKIYDTREGHIIVAAATICDLIAWVVFTAIIPSESRGSWLFSHLPVFFFFLGVGLSSLINHSEPVVKIYTGLSRLVFGPLFFIGVGMKIHWQESFQWQQFLVVLVVASLTKIAGVFVTAKWARFSTQDSKLMAFVLNARGAMEILFCSIALKLGLIDSTLFTSLTLMAILSSVMASPLVKAFVMPRKSV